MKTLQTSCQVCRRSISIEVEEPAMFSDAVMCEMATCDDCFNDHTERERTRIAKYHKAIEREEKRDNWLSNDSEVKLRGIKLPYKD